jgi:hypothetical protein
LQQVFRLIPSLFCARRQENRRQVRLLYERVQRGHVGVQDLPPLRQRGVELLAEFVEYGVGLLGGRGETFSFISALSFSAR